jgi:hypothetical protein
MSNLASELQVVIDNSLASTEVNLDGLQAARDGLSAGARAAETYPLSGPLTDLVSMAVVLNRDVEAAPEDTREADIRTLFATLSAFATRETARKEAVHEEGEQA